MWDRFKLERHWACRNDASRAFCPGQRAPFSINDLTFVGDNDAPFLQSNGYNAMSISTLGTQKISSLDLSGFYRSLITKYQVQVLLHIVPCPKCHLFKNDCSTSKPSLTMNFQFIDGLIASEM